MWKVFVTIQLGIYTSTGEDQLSPITKSANSYRKKMSERDTITLQSTSQSDIDEIENLILIEKILAKHFVIGISGGLSSSLFSLASLCPGLTLLTSTPGSHPCKMISNYDVQSLSKFPYDNMVQLSEVFAIAFALLAAGAVILTLNVLLLGCRIIFFQSLSLLGYCLFPLDVGAFICMLKDNVILKVVVVCVALTWSSWTAYPFMSTAVNPRRKALTLYPVVLMYVSVGFLIIAID
ncbi:hypothetical protein RND71_006499 [Anisodus tanguticus]|uniref:Protein YIP n=1 Tax=Anisodus tanguticus TaxID=243964 RepID=A0AAE1STG2_9SOLA|nr:hypothetical protein RND71_006499 [Anisodus tanguticus]